MQLHRKAADIVGLIEQAKLRQEKRSEAAAATYLPLNEQPAWCFFPNFVDKARKEVHITPKVIARLTRYYMRILNKINSVPYEEQIA
jgi:hypothetical protein